MRRRGWVLGAAVVVVSALVAGGMALLTGLAGAYGKRAASWHGYVAPLTPGELADIRAAQLRTFVATFCCALVFSAAVLALVRYMIRRHAGVAPGSATDAWTVYLFRTSLAIVVFLGLMASAIIVVKAGVLLALPSWIEVGGSSLQVVLGSLALRSTTIPTSRSWVTNVLCIPALGFPPLALLVRDFVTLGGYYQYSYYWSMIGSINPLQAATVLLDRPC